MNPFISVYYIWESFYKWVEKPLVVEFWTFNVESVGDLKRKLAKAVGAEALKHNLSASIQSNSYTSVFPYE